MAPIFRASARIRGYSMRSHRRIAGLIFQNVTITEEGWNPERLKFYE